MKKDRMTLEELGEALEAKGLKCLISGTLPPTDPLTAEELQHISEEHEKFLKESKKFLVEPQWNSYGKCPNCESKQYFDLFGGSCSKKCAKCDTCY